MIADDERPTQSFLAAMLRSFEDVKLIGEAENGAEAIELIERDRPDLAYSIFRCRRLTGSAS